MIKIFIYAGNVKNFDFCLVTLRYFLKHLLLKVL